MPLSNKEFSNAVLEHLLLNIARKNLITYRISQRNQLYPYHVRSVHALPPTDYQRRVPFGKRMLHSNMEDPIFSMKIMWTSKSGFKKQEYLKFTM